MNKDVIFSKLKLPQNKRKTYNFTKTMKTNTKAPEIGLHGGAFQQKPIAGTQ